VGTPAETKEEILATLRNFRAFGDKHVDLIRRFGRYPHRNRWLGREHSAEEREFLENGGETFGSG
jgi:uncharacterized protein (DUF924 family)